jgi:predicted RNase H-like nuclease
VAATYAEANIVAARLLGGKKISQQAWALRYNIERVAEVAAADNRIIEVHPEVSFRVMFGAHVAFPKTTWNGQTLRRRALERAGIVLSDELAEGGDVPVADVLDAAAAAWSARRYANRQAESLPPGAAPGARQVIWY